MSDDAKHSGPSSDDTQIIRRFPTGPLPVTAPPDTGPNDAASNEAASNDDASNDDDAPKTSIIRRHPTGSLPAASPIDEPATSYIEPASGSTSYIPRVRAATISRATPYWAITAAVAAILSGWTTAVIATDLITGWWQTDRLFCVAVGFLTAISAGATIGGLIAVLLRRRIGRLLVVVGSVIALLIFGSLFLAGAKLPPIVYAIPVFPVASIVLTMLPGTARWSAGAQS